MGLRKGQKELVEQYREGFCAIPAIPGGGKTHSLSLWAVEMIAQGLHKPGKILIVTYMNSAVNNFKQRIARELANRGISCGKDFLVSTIHGLCLQIIKEKPDRVGAFDELEIADSMTKLQILNSSIDEWRKHNESKFIQFVDEARLNSNRAAETLKAWQDKLCMVIQESIGDFKSRGLNPEQAIDKCRILPDSSILKCTADIYGIYDRRLKISGLMDFDDMLYQAKKVLEEDSILLEKYRKRFTYVCEDEAQDSNLIQSEILTMISQGNLLRVGDSNQAICGSFTNSDFKFFKEFCDLPQTIVHNITQSSRNTREIIDFANYFVRYVRENHPVQECRESLLGQYIETVGEDDERPNPMVSEYGVKLKIFGAWDEEAGAVVNRASQMIRTHPDKTIAILIPTSWRINDVVNILEHKNIPYEELDNTSKERNLPLRKLGRVIDFIASPEVGEKLALMFLDCFSVSNAENMSAKENAALTLENERHRELFINFLLKCPVEQLLYPDTDETEIQVPEDLVNTQLWEEFANRLTFIREILEYPIVPIEKLIIHIAELLKFDKEEMAIAQKVADDARFKKLQEPQFRLLDLSTELLSPKNSYSYYTGVIWDLKGYEPRPGVITVCTYHKSKGMEWDTVFLMGLNNADFPVELSDKFLGEYWFLKPEYKNPQALAKADMQRIMDGKVTGDMVLESKMETISERARLLYVGITRAKRHLFLSGFHANPGKKNEVPASKYLYELKKYIDGITENLK
ncbi:MAG: helicase UvrD [Clostridiales bacterium]|nr:helicase UvrD [Clostridiales bacterium]